MMKTKIKLIILAMLLVTMPMPQIFAMTRNTTPTTNQTPKPRTLLDKAWDWLIVEPIPPKKHYEIVLEIIKDLAPGLYDKIVQFDPNGSRHASLGDGIFIEFPNENRDGLPIFKINTSFMKLPNNMQRAVIAHEIGHYVLEHNITSTDNKYTLSKSIKKQDPSLSKLNPMTAMINAYTRTYEYEADRFAIMNLKIPSQDAIDMLNTLRSYEDNTIYCINTIKSIYNAIGLKFNTSPDLNLDKTFSRSHPLMDDRMQQIRNIQSEIELPNNAYPNKITPINWDKLQYNGLYRIDLEILNHPPTFEAAIKKYLPHMLSQAEEDIKEILTRKPESDFQLLSTEEWVNIHKFLLPIDSPMIEKLQACEAANISCIRKGERGTGVQIIQDNNNPDKFIMSFDTKTIDQISSQYRPKEQKQLTASLKKQFAEYLAKNPTLNAQQDNKLTQTITREAQLLAKESAPELTITQPQEEPALKFDKPIFTSPFAIKTNIASPYNKIGNVIKNTPQIARAQETPNALKINQQNQRVQQLAQQHQSEHLVAID